LNDYYEKPYAGKSQVRFCEEHKLLTIIKYYKKWNVFTRLKFNDENKPNYFAIIPAEIRYNKNLKAIEKLMYGEITALSNKEGYCFATNKYFAELFDVANNTVSRWISNIEKQGYIKVVIIRNKNKQIIERRIYMTNTYIQNCIYSYQQNSIYPIDRNVEDNNIKNRIDRLFNLIINNTEAKLENLSEKQNNEFLKILIKLEFNYTKEQIKIFTEDNIEKIKVIIFCIMNLVEENKYSIIQSLYRNKMIQIYDNCKKAQLKFKNTNKEIINFLDYYYMSIIKEFGKDI